MSTALRVWNTATPETRNLGTPTRPSGTPAARRRLPPHVQQPGERSWTWGEEIQMFSPNNHRYITSRTRCLSSCISPGGINIVPPHAALIDLDPVDARRHVPPLCEHRGQRSLVPDVPRGPCGPRCAPAWGWRRSSFLTWREENKRRFHIFIFDPVMTQRKKMISFVFHTFPHV